MKTRASKLCKVCGEPLDEADIILRRKICEECRLDRDIEREEAREARKHGASA